MPRFFVPSDGFDAEGKVHILGDDAYHIARALRMAAGDTLTVADMHGGEHLCRLLSIRDAECILEILESHAGRTEPPFPITLYMAYPKGDKLETVVQKAVELGAARIVPFFSSRCIKRPKADGAGKLRERLNRIAKEAAKQCGRTLLPTVADPLSFDAMLAEAARAHLPLFCYEGDGTRPLKEILTGAPTPSSVAVVVGCEGGFSSEEAERARRAGLLPTGLGPRILRCETAPAYVLSSISYQFEL